MVEDGVEEAVGSEDVRRDRRDRRRRGKRREVERSTEERPEPERLVDDDGERKTESNLQRDDGCRVDERVAHGVAPEDTVVVERPVVVPADEGPFEDLPVVTADVEGVADRKDEEEQEKRHRQRDEAVAHQRLASPLRSQSTADA